MRPTLLRSVVFALLFAPLPSLAATIVIDPMTDPYPSNACLPASMAPVVFQGGFCDGGSCLPGDIVRDCGGSDFEVPRTLPGVLAGFERTTVLTGAFGGPDA
jgi:hypothetical protein